jgi:hypothetical protein
LSSFALGSILATVFGATIGAIIDKDRYPLSPRIQTLKSILDDLRPEPAREPLPPPKHYEPPSRGRYRRRG